MAQFKLTSAKVLGDGLILRLQFEAGVSVGQSAINRLTNTDTPDYIAGLNSGLAATINGSPVEIIGLQAEDFNMPLPYLNPPSGSGSSLPDGCFVFLITISDSSGNEIYTGPPIISYLDDYGELGVSISAGNNLKFTWRVPVPTGGTLNIYKCTSGPNTNQRTLIYNTLQRVAAVPRSSLSSPTSYTMTAFASDNASFVPKSVTWTATCKLSTPLAMGVAATVNVPASLLIDYVGNSTIADTGFAVTNNSVVGTNGFLAVPENTTAPNTFSFTKTIYISYSRGTDTTGYGTITNPYKTVSYAMSQNSSAANVRFRLLRGDTWPVDQWKRAYWGSGLNTPTLYESYWYNYTLNNYTNDPGTRPIIAYGDAYYDMTVKNLDNGASLWQQTTDTTSTTAGNGDRPYIYFRGLSFRADLNYPNTGPSTNYGSAWPTCTIEDYVIISDCEFQNICLMGTYGSAQKLAPTGCMVHRSIIHSVHGSPISTYADIGSSGTSLVIPDKFINPWAGYSAITAGNTFIKFYTISYRWKINGWKVTVTEGSNTETKTLTTHGDGNGSYWNVDSAFVNNYTRAGVSISLDPTGQKFKIMTGTGSGSTIYTISSYNSSTRTATVTPSLPTVDTTSKIAFCGYFYTISPVDKSFNRVDSVAMLSTISAYGHQFQITSGTGSSSTTYYITGFDTTTRAATTVPNMPTTDSTTRITFLPFSYWDLGPHIQGIFLSHCADWLLSQSVFDKNGWNWHDDTATFNDIYCHNAYLSAMNRDIVTHSCYFIRAGSVGLQQRGGGITAYNVFAYNTHSNNMMSGGTVYKNLMVAQGLYNFSMSVSPTYLPAIIHDYNIVLKTTGALENRIPVNNYTGITGFNSDETNYAHSGVLARHNTFVDAGSFRNGQRLPIPGKLRVYNNLFVNRTTTGVDYQGAALQSAVCATLKTNWQNNGIISSSTSGTLAQQIADRNDWDYNAYKITTQSTAFSWPDVTTNNLTTWKTTGRDPHSIALSSDPTFTSGSYSMDNWAAANSLGSTFDSFWPALRDRQENVWNSWHDAANCYIAFQTAYTPTISSVPSVDTTVTGYYGAIDNRSLTAQVNYTLSTSTLTCYVGDTVTLSVTPSTSSNEALTISCTGATPSVSSLVWSNESTVKTFTVTPIASGTVTITLYKSAISVAGPINITVQAPATANLPNRLAIRRGGKMFRRGIR